MATVRSNRRIERAGVNAVRTLLEDHEHIVQEIDGGNDHGEDLIINVTRAGRRTGHYFAVQVKSGQKYKRARGYAIPVEDHFEDWRQSRIPVVGLVYDPDAGEIFWVNLTKELRAVSTSPSWVQISSSSRLSHDTIRGFIAETEAYVDNAGMRVRSGTSEDGFASAARARRGLDAATAPNPMYEGLGDFALRHEQKIDTVMRDIRLALPLMALAIIMAWEWPYQIRFVERNAPGMSPLPWVLNVYTFLAYAAVTMFFEFRAGRFPKQLGQWFSLFAINFLWVPMEDKGEGGWWGTAWIILGVFAPSIGHKALLVFFVGYAKERKRRAQESA
ncbi:DUF4365 domain-containing protein [Kitasatospora sp. NPDC090308]|uniref:DUF4365 domain-containing protein n=1 Tax=Kitasatospora sp. NPDC090308 TaxID=3364082 RepID=UPI00382236B7